MKFEILMFPIIADAQARIASDTSLSPAQVSRARELLQELLVTITSKPEQAAQSKFCTNILN